MTVWKLISKINNTLVPAWLFKFLKKHPFYPIVAVVILYFGNAFFDGEKDFSLPCISIFGNKCIENERAPEMPYRGGY